MQLGLASIKATFQCKRWQRNVTRPEVDKFRGAIQGKSDQGIFFTTSDSAKGAVKTSVRKGAVPIILVNGSEMVDLMVEREIGVKRKPIYLFEIDESAYVEATGDKKELS